MSHIIDTKEEELSIQDILGAILKELKLLNIQMSLLTDVTLTKEEAE